MTTEVGVTEPITSVDDTATAAAVQQPAPVRTLSVIVSLVLLIAISVSAYLFYDLQQVKKDQEASRQWQQQQTELATAVAALRNDSANISQEIAELRTAQAAMLADLASVRNQPQQNNFDWLLAEVEYLLIIAGQRLALDQDAAVALSALQTAATRLRDFNDPRLLPARKQLNADINALQAVNNVDISGLALYLLDIAARADKLPLKPLPGDASDEADATPQEQTVATELPFWRRLGTAILNSLKDLVRVYHTEDGTPVALLPEQRYHIYQNLSLQLETATRAVLRKETHNFKAALTMIQNGLRENFDTRDPAVGNIIDSLNRMMVIDLNPQLPTIDSSMETLRALIRETTDDPQTMATPEESVP
ncbi:MAG: heme biosynthesis protein [Gammaproteobacteria bacterium]|nr:heme biosynthesis protein [Gammaproteobacteria bacterium]